MPLSQISSLPKLFLKAASILFVGLVSGLLTSPVTAQTLQQPATRYLQFVTGGTPTLTKFNGRLYLTYGSASTGLLNVASASDGVNFTAATQIPSALVGASPAPFNNGGNTLYVFYRDASDGTLKQVNSTDGVNFTGSLQLQQSNGAGAVYSSTPVSVAFFGNYYYVAYTDGNGHVQVAQTDGQTIYSIHQVSSNYTTASAPSILQGAGQLIVGFQAGNHMLVMEGSFDTNTWNETPYPGILMGSAPNLSIYNLANLYVTFQSNDQYHILFQTTGQSPSTLTSPANVSYRNILMAGAPSCVQDLSTQSGVTLFCAFKSNDQYNLTFIAAGN
ncbi:sialidase family protein [Granulicella sp. dw_53]|uniref:sialidase family protein n=1 Tax=Granulicella sp. dw_53 TaxID=2719792 RepID=UPI001BD61615|nr:sialidase family protein [Granulicella sp. dw_53]